MAKFDLSVVGLSGGNNRWRVAASATRGRVGEPLMNTPSYTSGVTDSNVVVVCTDATPTIGTHEFRGICQQDFEVDSSSTVIAHYTHSTMFIPYVTKVRGDAETSADIDTQSELTGVLGDLVRFGLASSSYTIQSGGEADTGALQIVDGNISRQTLDAVVDARAFRTDVAA